MYIDKTALGEGVPQGMSKQVSAEFNLLHRFHSAISRRDEGCTKIFMKEQAQLRLEIYIILDDPSLQEHRARSDGPFERTLAPQSMASRSARTAEPDDLRSKSQ